MAKSLGPPWSSQVDTHDEPPHVASVLVMVWNSTPPPPFGTKAATSPELVQT